MARPSKGEVPRPTSSSRIRLRGVALCRMLAVSTISTRNVLCPRARLSWAPTRVSTRSTRPIRAERAGRDAPTSARPPRSPAPHRASHPQGALRPGGHGRADLLEELELEPRHALLGAEGPALVLLQLRGDEPLGPHERLAPHILRRDLGGMGVAHLDGVAEDPVEAHAEGRNAGPLALPPLERRE